MRNAISRTLLALTLSIIAKLLSFNFPENIEVIYFLSGAVWIDLSCYFGINK
jgi:hypothetical protein